MRKIFKSFLILFVFCLSFTLCGTFTFSTDNAYADAATIIKLANATDDTKGVKGFADYVNGYAAANANDNLILTEDIVLTTDLTNTIGTAAAPFAGTFNGRGYKISNATVDLSGASSDNQYLGIFGYVQGTSTKRATIKNLSISGNLTLKAANPISLFAGGFAGFAKCAFFENVQLNANVVANFSNDFNLTFGNMIGQMVDSEINGAICRPTAVSVFEIDNTDAKFYSLGGVVGEQNNSQIFFAVVNETIKVDIAPEFIGDLNVGGISGKISQGGSKIINVALENGYEIKGRETNLNLETTIKVGQIAGLVANPAPASNAETRIMSLSYIHYADNKDVSLFGDLGGYKFVEQSTKDYITVSTEVFGTEEYFSDQKWHDMYGEWDFDSVWYVGANTINLQCFYGNFIVKLANNLNNDVLEATSTLQSSYRYGESVSLSFKFKTGMDKYYNLSGLQLDGAQIAGINENTDGSYRFTGANEKFYSISNNAEEKSFSITINSVNLSTKGEYGIDVPEKKFTISITSKLFVEDEGGELQVVEGETPAYVYYASSTSSEVYRLQIVDKEIKYGRPEPYAFGTIEKDNSPIKFDGWFIEKEGGDTELADENAQILSFDFGVPFEDDVLKVISDNCSIYARYVENACRLTFDMDEGVAKVELFAGEKVITDSTQFADVSKTAEKIRLDIYILKDFAFNVDDFIKNLIYKETETDELVFCTLIEEPFEESGLTHYKFHINMNALNRADFEETFNIKIQTEEEKKEDKTWIWIVVGAGGGVVLIVLIIVIVVVAKRRGGGGRTSRGGGSFKKKNVKGMYF